MKHKLLIYELLFLMTIIFLTIGYASFTVNFSITDAVAKIRAHKIVRINGVTSMNSAVSNLDYSQSSIVNTVSIPAGSSVTYNVKVTNLGNVPVAVSAIAFTNTSLDTSNLSASINENNYIKICEESNCTGPVSKSFDLTITNNGSTSFDSDLDLSFTFSEVYEVIYDGSHQGEVLSGHNYTYTFANNAPSAISVSGNHTDDSYSNNTISITNVTGDITIYKAYNINYNGSLQGTAIAGTNYTYTFKSEWPISVEVNGTYDSQNYTNHVLNINNVGSDISVIGTIGRIEITAIDYVSSTNVLRQTDPTFDGMSANFNIVFKRDENATTNEFKIVYRVSVTNNYYSDYIFRGIDFNPVINASSDEDSAVLVPSVEGVENGEKIPPETTKTFNLILVLDATNPNATYSAEVGTDVDTTDPTEDEGEIQADITPLTGDLQAPNEMVPFQVEVINTFDAEREYRLLSTNSNFVLVDANGNSLNSFTIPAKSSDTITVYVKANSNAMFSQPSATTNILLSSDGIANVDVGSLTFDVDVHEGVDNTKVTVSNATITMYQENNKPPTPGKVVVSWQRDDTGGSAVNNYGVILYNADNGSEVKNILTNSGATTYTFTDLDDGTYYAVVYGIDDYHNSGEEDVASAQNAPGYATRSANTTLKWRFKVDTSGLSYLNISGDGVAYLGDTYKTTLSPAGTWPTNDKLPSSLTSVYMNDQRLTSRTGYSYSSSSGALEIYNVNGDIKLNGSADSSGCLVEGTKVLLANGKYKNIENIDYDDLIMTYSYETGEFVPEYPIWIEKTKKTLKYQQNTFSDGTILNTMGYHGVYETNLNRFVSVDNPSEFHIGSKIAKLNKEKNGFETVTVTDIKIINEPINYYHVVSTRYYNIIANDLLTTDGTVILSNLYGFTDKMTWPKDIRDKAMQDIYTYDDLKDTIPYYMFKGMRAEEGKVLANYGLDLNTFKMYLSLNQNNPYMLKEPIKLFNKNVWMITTSEDNVTDLNKRNYLKQEGTTYILPKSNNKNFIGWLNTSDNKMYYPGDSLEVYYGIYLKAIYK